MPFASVPPLFDPQHSTVFLSVRAHEKFAPSASPVMAVPVTIPLESPTAASFAGSTRCASPAAAASRSTVGVVPVSCGAASGPAPASTTPGVCDVEPSGTSPALAGRLSEPHAVIPSTKHVPTEQANHTEYRLIIPGVSCSIRGDLQTRSTNSFQFRARWGYGGPRIGTTRGLKRSNTRSSPPPSTVTSSAASTSGAGTTHTPWAQSVRSAASRTDALKVADRLTVPSYGDGSGPKIPAIDRRASGVARRGDRDRGKPLATPYSVIEG